MKRRNIILVLLVILVWGIALRTVFTRKPVSRPGVQAKGVASPTKAEERLVIDPDAPDPFLSIFSDTVTVADTPKPVVRQKTEPVVQDLPRYSGFISTGKEKLAILEVAGKYYFVKEKDKIPGYVVKKIREEWLTLKSGKAETKIEIHKKAMPHYVVEY